MSTKKEGTYYSRNKEACKQRAFEYRKKRPEYSLWQNCKHRAIRKGLDFNISINDIVIPEICPVLGIPLTEPSVDRVDNSKGYVRGNVQIISNSANTLKGALTIEMCEQLLAYMKAHRGVD